MQSKKQGQNSPVECDDHYAVLKVVEATIKDYLIGLDHEYLLVGLRVAYDILDSFNEPDMMPYSMEFGYLKSTDSPNQSEEVEEVTEEELLAATTEEVISVGFLDELYDIAKQGLEEHAGVELKIDVSLALTGSPIKVYTVGCWCSNPRRRKYCYSRCYCSTRGC